MIKIRHQHVRISKHPLDTKTIIHIAIKEINIKIIIRRKFNISLLIMKIILILRKEYIIIIIK